MTWIPRVCIVGTGFVGLTTAVCFADRGFKVYAYDVDDEKIRSISQGNPLFYEPKLQRLLRKALRRQLRCTNDLKEALPLSEFTFICVNTPSQPNGRIDTSQVEACSREIGSTLPQAKSGHVVVVKSTVVPGTTQNKIKRILENESNLKVGEAFGLCVNPEFLREGSAVNDTLHPSRIVIGECDSKSGSRLEKLMRRFHGETCPPILHTSLPTAEMAKYASNAFLATKVSFINEIANICERLPAVDIVDIADIMGFDPRIGRRFLNAGLGFGGACFPKDLKALIGFAEDQHVAVPILSSVLKVNENQPTRALTVVEQALKSLQGKRIALLGLSFKPETSDMRQAVSVTLTNELLAKGAEVIAYDPAAMDEAKSIFGDKIQYANSPLECIADSDCAIVVTEWDHFKHLTPDDYVRTMRSPIILDGRRIYDAKKFLEKTRFFAVGLGS